MPDHSPETRLLSGPAFSPTPTSRQTAEISFGQILRVLRRRYRLVLLLAALGTGIGAFLASQVPPTYQASAVLRVGGERRALTGGMEAPTQEVGRTTDPILSLVQLVRSRSVLGAVVDSVGLQLHSRTPEFLISELSGIQVDSRAAGDSVVLEFAPTRVTARYGSRQVSGAYGQALPLGMVRFAVNRRPDISTAVLGTTPREMAIDWLLGSLVVAPRTETDLIDVVFVSDDPRLAQQVVNRTVKIFQTLNIQSAKEKSLRRRVVLGRQLAQNDSILAQAQADLAGFRSRLQMGSSDSKLASEQNALLALEERRIQMETDHSTYMILHGQLKSGRDEARTEALRVLASLPAVADNPRVSGFYQQLTVYQSRLDSMNTYGTAETNPDRKALRTMIANTQNTLTDAVSGQLKSIEANIKTLGDLRLNRGKSIQVLPAVVEEESRLASRVQTYDRVGAQLRQDYQHAVLAEEVEAGDVEIVDLADVPYRALSSTTAIRLGLGLVLGLLLGGCLAFLLEALNTSIRRPEDIESLLHIPGLAVIPRLEAGPPASRPRTLIKGGKTQGISKASGSAIGTETQPFSVGTEAFRMLRTSLIWSDGAEQLRTLVVTSAAPGDGKTLTAANLSASFANDGLRVLLVDCDIRRPRLHGLFRVPRSPGLLDLLAPPSGSGDSTVGSLSFGDGEVASEDALTHVLRPTPIRGLTLLPCGALPTNASNLLSGIRMRSLLKEIKQRFDIVILDTPPVLATADAGILGSLADGVLLVVRAGQTDRSAAQRAYQQLTNAGGRVIGAVLNDPKGELSQYGEYYYPYEYVPEKV